MMKSTTFRRSAVSASGVTEMSTWFDASTGTLVSWLTGTASSLTFSRFAYSFARIHAGPLHASPWPDVFSTSHGALARTPTRSTPAFLMASTRGLVPGAGTGTSAAAVAAAVANTSAAIARRGVQIMAPPGFIFIVPRPDAIQTLPGGQMILDNGRRVNAPALARLAIAVVFALVEDDAPRPRRFEAPHRGERRELLALRI